MSVPPRYRRVVLDLPPREADRNLLQAAVELARLLDAELHAVFVQDQALAALADFPFARELRLPTHDWQPMTGARLADDWRAAIGKARRDLDSMRAARGVRGETEIQQGDPASLIATICTASDIVVVAAPAQAADRVTGVHTQRSLAAYHCMASVLMLPSARMPGQGAIAVLAGDQGASRAVAAQIAARAGAKLVELLPTGRNGADILAALRGVPARLLVVTRGAVLPDADATLQAIAEGGAVPVLVLEPVAPG